MSSPTIAAIQAAVCAHFGVGIADLLSDCRGARLVLPRHVAIWLSRRLTRKSYAVIGRAFAGRDHTTIQHAIRRIDAIAARGNGDIWKLLAELQATSASVWPQIELAHGWIAFAQSRRAAA
jgi:chromosomal replication initiator protein